MPTMRSCSPSAYSTSVGSSVRQTMRCGPALIGALTGTACAWTTSPRAVALVQPALVQAVFGAVPELDPLRLHAQAGPARRARHVAAVEFGSASLRRCFERLARVQRLRLLRRPCTELAAARARGEIGIGLGVVDDFHRALDPHLHALAHPRPVEQQRGLRIGLQFAALAAVEVGVEDEAAGIERLEQDGARRGPARPAWRWPGSSRCGRVRRPRRPRRTARSKVARASA